MTTDDILKEVIRMTEGFRQRHITPSFVTLIELRNSHPEWDTDELKKKLKELQDWKIIDMGDTINDTYIRLLDDLNEEM